MPATYWHNLESRKCPIAVLGSHQVLTRNVIMFRVLTTIRILEDQFSVRDSQRKSDMNLPIINCP